MRKSDERLLDQLEGIIDLHGTVGFGLVRTTTPLSDHELEAVARRAFERTDRIRFWGQNFFAERVGHRRRYICWWGDKKEIASLKEWLGKAAIVLPKRLPNATLKRVKNYGGLLYRLCEAAEDFPEVASRVKLIEENEAIPDCTAWEVEDAPQVVSDIVRHILELPPPDAEKPVWDAERRELRYRGKLIKRFKSRKTNQELVLACFQEEGWPSRIIDPIPPKSGKSIKRRLAETRDGLNENHATTGLIYFRGDGSTEHVVWEAGFRPKKNRSESG